MKKVFIFLISVLLLTSCIPNKDLIYLQGKPEKLEDVKRINNEPYRLRVNDILLIDIKSSNTDLVNFFNLNESGGVNGGQVGGQGGLGFFTGFIIDKKGNIRLPYLGETNVLGYTTEEVRKKIETMLSSFFNSSDDIFVDVKLDGIRLVVMGEVGSPGPLQIYNSQLNILEAITSAGDILITGNRKDVEVIRIETSGEVKRFNVDLTDISAINSEVFFIKPNDFINVKPLKQKSWGTGTTGLATFTTVTSTIGIIVSMVLLLRGI